MTYLLLSIAFSSLLVIVFKLFSKYQINGLNAIMFNYFVCFLTAWIFIGEFPISKSTLQAEYLPYATILSLFFIIGFNIVSMTINKFGIALATIMQKMSLIIPVSFALFYFGESNSLFNIIGILLALGSIILINIPDEKLNLSKNQKINITLPLLTWLFSGVIEIGLLTLSKHNLVMDGDPRFFALLFVQAGILGLIIVIGKKIFSNHRVAIRDLIAGIILGIPNFFSMYFLLKALGLENGGSRILPINNIAIILLSTGIAIFIFREKLNKINYIGIFFAILSIVLIGLS